MKQGGLALREGLSRREGKRNYPVWWLCLRKVLWGGPTSLQWIPHFSYQPKCFSAPWAQTKVNMNVAQSCLTLCDPMNSTVGGILQARILEWVAVPFSKGSPQPSDRTQVSYIAGGFGKPRWSPINPFASTEKTSHSLIHLSPTLCLPVYLLPLLLTNILCFSISQVSFNDWPMTFQLWSLSWVLSLIARKGLDRPSASFWARPQLMGGQPMDGLLLNQVASLTQLALFKGFQGWQIPWVGGHDQVPQNLLIQSLGRGVGEDLQNLDTQAPQLIMLSSPSGIHKVHSYTSSLLCVSYLCCVTNHSRTRLMNMHVGWVVLAWTWLILDQLAQHLWSAGRSAVSWFSMASLSLARGWVSTMVIETPESSVSYLSADYPEFAYTQVSWAGSALHISLLNHLLTKEPWFYPNALQLGEPLFSSDSLTYIDHLYPSLGCQIYQVEI